MKWVNSLNYTELSFAFKHNFSFEFYFAQNSTTGSIMKHCVHNFFTFPANSAESCLNVAWVYSSTDKVAQNLINTG